MKKITIFKRSLSKFILPLLLILTTSAQADDVSYSEMFVFGDSLSDTGNAVSVSDFGAGFSAGFPIFPVSPYTYNSFSNGPVAVEVLATKLGLSDSSDSSLHISSNGLTVVGNNYAVAGATAAVDLTLRNDLSSQVWSFGFNHHYGAPDNALYVIVIGGNDIQKALLLSEHDAVSAVQDAVSAVRSTISSLYTAGARSFLLVNSPNIGLLPRTIAKAELFQAPSLIDSAHTLSKLYRKELHDMADELSPLPGLNLTEFDLFKFFNKLVLKKADKYGFTNTTDACYSAPYFNLDCYDYNGTNNIDQFIFIDEVHPTAKVHALVGKAMYGALEDDEDEDEIED